MVTDKIVLSWGKHHPPMVIHLKSSWSGWNSWETSHGKIIWDEKDPENFTIKIQGGRPSLEEAILLLLAAGVIDEDAIKRRIVN